jgi:hypothetical protein
LYGEEGFVTESLVAESFFLKLKSTFAPNHLKRPNHPKHLISLQSSRGYIYASLIETWRYCRPALDESGQKTDDIAKAQSLDADKNAE